MNFSALTLLAGFGSLSFSGCKAPAPLLPLVCEVWECPACTPPFAFLCPQFYASFTSYTQDCLVPNHSLRGVHSITFSPHLSKVFVYFRKHKLNAKASGQDVLLFSSSQLSRFGTPLLDFPRIFEMGCFVFVYYIFSLNINLHYLTGSCCPMETDVLFFSKTQLNSNVT